MCCSTTNRAKRLELFTKPNFIIFKDSIVACSECDFQFMELANMALIPNGQMLKNACPPDLEKHQKETGHKEYSVSYA